MQLRGTVGIVTGGGTGIGRSVSMRLAGEGVAGLVINYSRSSAEARATAKRVEESGCQVRLAKADVTDESAVHDMIAGAIEQFGRLDVLVCCAGVTSESSASAWTTMTAPIWHRIIDVNVRGPFNCIRHAAQHLRKARGAVVSISSIGGYRGSGASVPYNVSKAALNQLTRSLALALAPDVRVNAVAPGFVATRWFRRYAGTAEAQRVASRAKANTPLARLARPDDIAQAVVGLLQFDFVTGQVLIVDGGRCLTY
jgi:3-oxoacyl-[acyl-carrier protein] reductase